ncbi:hypothetical protein J6590_101183 [Homalodisca vitripennis]|nr:hypothetical protein J6590_101183 [Homalodisca vitripennis]
MQALDIYLSIEYKNTLPIIPISPLPPVPTHCHLPTPGRYTLPLITYNLVSHTPIHITSMPLHGKPQTADQEVTVHNPRRNKNAPRGHMGCRPQHYVPTDMAPGNGSSTENSSDEEGPIRADGGIPGTSVRGGSSSELHNCLKSYLMKPGYLLELGNLKVQLRNREHDQ